MKDCNGLKVSFIIPTFNADKYLERCLKSIRSQDNQQDILEIIVADMGSTDRTIELANRYGCTVFHDPELYADRRVVTAQKKAKGEIIIFLSADNELACSDWLEKMLKPFENENVYGAFAPIVNSQGEKPFTRYFNLMQRDPFSWYVIGKVNPRNVTKKFPVLKETDEYVIFNYTTERYDLIAFYHQGFTVRSKYMQEQEMAWDDILPVIEMIKKGYKVAYVKNAGIHHHTLDSFSHFIRKFNSRMIERFSEPNFGYKSRRQYMCREMKIRQYTWFLYSLTFVGSSIDMIRGFWADKNLDWVYHPIACFGLSCSILINYFIFLFNRMLKKVEVFLPVSNSK